MCVAVQTPAHNKVPFVQFLFPFAVFCLYPPRLNRMNEMSHQNGVMDNMFQEIIC